MRFGEVCGAGRRENRRRRSSERACALVEIIRTESGRMGRVTVEGARLEDDAARQGTVRLVLRFCDSSAPGYSGRVSRGPGPGDALLSAWGEML